MREISAGLTKDNPMTPYAADFSLYEIGTFDIYTMKITPTDPTEHVCEIRDLLDDPTEPDATDGQ